MTTRVLDSSPGLGGLYLRAALPAIPGLGSLPGLRHERGEDLSTLGIDLSDVTVDVGRLETYRKICGFPLRETLPATYPHVLAFPLHLSLMTSPGFPFAAMGAVHISNRIVQHRPIRMHEHLTLSVRAEHLAPHRRGRTVTLVSEAAVDGETVWRDETVVLGRGPGTPDAPDVHTDLPDSPPDGPVRWRLESGLGRRYAAASGDRNPIHLYDVTARAFGFRRHIAHGMWTKARCLAHLGSRTSDAFSVEVAFKRPVELPGTVSFGARRIGDHTDFGVSGTDGTPHLVGRLRPA